MEIHAVVEPGEILHTRAGAAPEAAVGRAKRLEVPGSHRLEIGRHSRVGVHRGQDLIDVDLLVEVRVLDVTGDLEQVMCELRHVVGIAGLVVDVVAVLIECPRGVKMLILAVSTGYVGMILQYDAKESAGRVEVRGLARPHGPIAIQGADELRDRHVGVLAAQVVGASGKRREQAGVIEDVSNRQVIGTIRVLVELVQGVVQSAVLLAKHRRFRARAPARSSAVEPVSQLACDRQGVSIPLVLVNIDQTGEDLVHRVVGHPNSGQARPGGAAVELVELGNVRCEQVATG